MSLFDSASLVVTPSGYKEDKLYSIKPTDGSGDLVVTRATTATRVNSAGLVELVPYNLLTYSEQFDNAIWSKYQTSITANTTIAPNGTLTADTITDNTATDVHIVNQGVNVGAGTYTISVYAKANTLSNINLQWYDGVSAFSQSNVFNLSTGITTGANQSIENVGNGWYRCSYTITTTQTGTQYPYVVLNNGSSAYYTGTGQSLYIWGGQLVTGTSAKEYFPTTDRLNVPRLDYTNSSCPSILVEPQRTNLSTYSEQFDNGAWSGTLSKTSNTTTAPDGNNTADTISGTGFIGQTLAPTGACTFSVYAKAGTSTIIRLNVYDGVTDRGANYNLSTGAITGAYNSPITSIQQLNNGWWRLIITTTNAVFSWIQIHKDTTGTAFVWGAQLEAGSYPTSYIPTVASTVTRNADVISKTGISSLIGQTEGTMFWDATNLFTSGTRSLALMYTSGSSFFQIYLNSSNQIRVDVNGSFLFLGGSISANTQYKIAFAYKSGNYALYLNGVQIATSASTTIPSSLNDLYIGNSLGSEQSGSYKSAILWKERLSNTELAQLTTI